MPVMMASTCWQCAIRADEKLKRFRSLMVTAEAQKENLMEAVQAGVKLRRQAVHRRDDG